MKTIDTISFFEFKTKMLEQQKNLLEKEIKKRLSNKKRSTDADKQDSILPGKNVLNDHNHSRS